MTEPTTTLSRRTIWLCLCGIFLLAIALRFWLISQTVVPSRDGLIFVRIAMQLVDPPKSRFEPARQLDGPADVLRETDQAPGYPLAILAMCHLRGQSHLTNSGAELLQSAQIVSAIAGVLLTFPFFAVTRRIFGPLIGLLATLWLQMLPVFVEVTGDALSDGLYLLTSMCAFWFALNLLDRERWWTASINGFLIGAAIGTGYLVRPDSLIVGLGIGIVLLGTCIRRFVQRAGGSRLLLGGIAMIVGSAICMSPYVAIIGKLTNKPTGQGLIDQLDEGPTKKTYYERDSKLPNVSPPIAAWYSPTANANSSRMWWATKALTSELLKAGHYLLPFVAIIGLLLTRPRWADARLLMVLAVLGLHLAVLWFMAGRIGYVSERHTLLSVLLLTMFGAVGVVNLIAWGGTKFTKLSPKLFWCFWLALIVIPAMPVHLKRLHAERTGHREAGEWIRNLGNPAYPVVDPFGWAEFYSGRTVQNWTAANPYKRPAVYAIVEPNAKSHHSRLPWLEFTTKLAEKGKIVFQYPPDVPLEQVRIAVYECPPLK